MNILHEKDSTYKHLADEAYNITPNQKKVTIETSNHSEIDFKVIGFRQNKFNGLKMAGLSPMDKNKNVNTDELYIVYAGTDPDLLADFGSDVVEDLRIGMAKFGGGLRIPPTKKKVQFMVI
ncbi:TPA: hypothetical protein ACN4HR_001699 [Staphylococcus aureus]|uniref:hypothetical protein n=1 Tax=Staphylococcus aureus TaxID=1280 RepID=UPI000ACF71AA